MVRRYWSAIVLGASLVACGCSPVGYIVVGAVAATSGGGSSGGGKGSTVPPGAPSGVTATGGTGSVTIDWSTVARADSYDIYWSNSPGVTPGSGTRIQGVNPPYPHTGLVDGTDYHYVVTAVNKGGSSGPSNEDSARPVGAPSGVSAQADLSQVTLTWSPATGADTYNLYWLNSSGVTPSTGTRTSGVTSPYVHAPLNNGDTYYYIVTGANTFGGGAESDQWSEVVARPIAAPTGVAALGGSEDVTISWSASAGSTAYNIYWRDTAGVTKANGNLVSGVTSPHTVTGLTNGTTYYFIVTALNTVGDGVESGESTEVSASPIEPPTNVTITGTTSTTTVNWAPVLGATGYSLYWATTPGVTKTTGQRISPVNPPFDHTGLANGLTHYYVICSLNSVGGGAESAESAEVSATPLAAPTGITAHGETQRVNLDWNAVPGATSYTVYWRTTPGVNSTNGTPIPGVSSPYVHTGLTDATTYYYVVAAVSSVGGGSESVESAEVNATPLSTPTGATAVPADSQVTLTWNSVTAATSCSVYWSNSPGVTKTTGTRIPGLSSPHDHLSLTNGQAYYYVVTAVNATAESDESPEMMAMPIAPPAGVSAIPGDSHVTISWSPCAGATSYNLYWANATGVTQGTGTQIPGVTSPYVHTPLTNGQPYYYVLTALNASGESADSAEVWAIPIAAPTAVAVEVGDSQTTMTWDPVVGATSYNIYWANTAGVTKGTGTRIAGVTSPHVHSGLTNGTDYYYVVTALNATGESVESSEVWAIPVAAPTGVVAAAGDAQVTISWNAVPFATSYNLYWANATGVTKQSGTQIPGVTSPYVHSSLTNGTDYYYVVTVENAVSEGQESAEVAAGPIASITGFTAFARTSSIDFDWNPSAGAATYNLYWSTSAGVTKGTGNRIAGVTAPYTHTGLTNGQTYYYVLTAENTVGDGYETPESAELFGQPVAVPLGVTAVVGNTQNMIRWKTPVDGAQTYNLYWDVNPGVTQITGTQIQGVTNPYQHQPLLNGTTYYYVVTAANAVGVGGESFDSVEARATPYDAIGTLDTSFDTDGWLSFIPGGIYTTGKGIATDFSDRPVVAGKFNIDGTRRDDMVICRFEVDGALDTSFNGQGWAAHDNAAGWGGVSKNDGGEGVVLDPSGQILTTGYSRGDVTNTPDMVTWRYSPSGLLDTSFDDPSEPWGPGWVVGRNAGGWDQDDFGYGIALDASGRILVTGTSHGNSNRMEMVIWRYNVDGTKDTSFDNPSDGRGPGWVVHHNAAGAGEHDYGYSITTDSLGRILVAGAGVTNWIGPVHAMVIWRYLPDGNLDATFDGDGWVVYTGTGDTIGYGITTDGAGRILVAGYTRGPFGNDDLAIWRYNADGTPDTTFDGDGVVTHNNATGTSATNDDHGYAISLDGSGRILVAGEGYNQSNGEFDMVVWRFNPDGTLDTTFDTDGRAISDTGTHDRGYAIATDSTGRILVAGEHDDGSGATVMRVWCYQ